MDGGQALFAFWVFGQQPMNRRREGRVGGLWGRSMDFSVRDGLSCPGDPTVANSAGHNTVANCC